MTVLLVYQISYRYLKTFMSHRGFEKLKTGHTNTHTFRHQLKITFLDVLDYSEYFVTNISNFSFSQKHISLSEEKKWSHQSPIVIKLNYFHQIKFFFKIHIRCATKPMCYFLKNVILRVQKNWWFLIRWTFSKKWNKFLLKISFYSSMVMKAYCIFYKFTPSVKRKSIFKKALAWIFLLHLHWSIFFFLN